VCAARSPLYLNRCTLDLTSSLVFQLALPALDVRHFYFTGGISLYGFNIFYELTRKSVADDLGRLARLIADGRLRPQIDVEAPWTQVGDIAQQLLNRHLSGKAVLHVSS